MCGNTFRALQQRPYCNPTPPTSVSYNKLKGWDSRAPRENRPRALRSICSPGPGPWRHPPGGPARDRPGALRSIACWTPKHIKPLVLCVKPLPGQGPPGEIWERYGRFAREPLGAGARQPGAWRGAIRERYGRTARLTQRNDRNAPRALRSISSRQPAPAHLGALRSKRPAALRSKRPAALRSKRPRPLRSIRSPQPSWHARPGPPRRPEAGK